MKPTMLVAAFATFIFTNAPSPRDPAWVAKRVADWQPTERERRWEQIGWAKDLRDAERLSKQHNRPVFLYTHDGHLAVGRC